MKTTFFSLKALLKSVLIVGLATPAFSQETGHFTRANTVHGGYWNLKTNTDIHGTLVRFYNSDSQLVYQESMPNRFIKLSPKNIRRLDEALNRLTANQLVATTVRTASLPYVEQERPVSRRAETPTSLNPAELAFGVQLYTPAGKPAVHVVLANPTLDRLTITVLSAEKTVVYEHVTHLSASRHHLNFGEMPPGTYQIRVKSSTQEYQQPVTLVYGQRDAVVQINRPDSAPTLAISHK
ncbi:hypothetical protein [Spirosoma pollinicola]|uniref:Uncharacterized protein n=1 Tax=Spirosoma pollinicola TaxID=2057025 RepID=A0A2K8Z1F5_9BACT|nr:hypothetical protein [Spirosoma pollinicola]AUD03681.1 hypothetical protein CWM47_18715 [Spirosoma pollinicola]